MLSSSRGCPVCGSDDASTPDPLGVHRCRSCQVEFRPPIRVPIRRAGVTAIVGAGGDKRAIRWMIALASVTIGVAIAAGDSQAPSRNPAFALEEFHVTVPSFEPPSFDALGLHASFDSVASVELDHEVHGSVLDDGELSATGLVRNPGATKLSGVSMRVRCLDSSGSLLATHAAVVACPSVEPGEVCGWSLEARADGASEFVFEAKGAPAPLAVLPTLSLRGRFDHEGAPISSLALDGGDALTLDPAAGALSFGVDGDVMVLDSWATITSFDAQHQVLGVAAASGGELVYGAERFELAVAIVGGDDAQIYEVRVGGELVIVPPETRLPNR